MDPRRKQAVRDNHDEAKATRQCDICLEIMVKSLSSNFFRHFITRHVSLPPSDQIMCDKCGQIYVSHLSLWAHFYRDHMQSAADVVEYACDLCSVSRRRKTNLTLHLRREHPQEAAVYLCAECNYSTEYRYCLYLHATAKHQGKLPKRKRICDICDEACWQLQKHIMDQHLLPVKERAYFVCDWCVDTMQFRKKVTLTRHLRWQHQMEAAKHHCADCDYNTDHTGEMYIHSVSKHK